MTRKLIILRGVPGSGKSTTARQILEWAKDRGHTTFVGSADQFHMFPVDSKNPSGEMEYRYDPDRSAEAHRKCRLGVERALREGIEVVIVDNTNTTSRSVLPFVEAGVAFDYDVEFREPASPWWLSVRPLLRKCRRESDLRKHCKSFAERNSHGVPEATILKMLAKYETDLTVESVLTELD